MRHPHPRLRVFAGPNGSGKSTLKSELRPEWVGVYVNPDEVERSILAEGHLDFGHFGLSPKREKLVDYLLTSTLLNRASLSEGLDRIVLSHAKLYFPQIEVNAYHASVLSAFIRDELLSALESLTIETVMSSPDKIEVLKNSRKLGFRNYLYFIATESPLINIQRVRNRVLDGGHTVPEEKIESRYYRSLELLREAIRHTDRAYIFDNSRENEENLWVA